MAYQPPLTRHIPGVGELPACKPDKPRRNSHRPLRKKQKGMSHKSYGTLYSMLSLMCTRFTLVIVGSYHQTQPISSWNHNRNTGGRPWPSQTSRCMRRALQQDTLRQQSALRGFLTSVCLQARSYRHKTLARWQLSGTSLTGTPRLQNVHREVTPHDQRTRALVRVPACARVRAHTHAHESQSQQLFTGSSRIDAFLSRLAQPAPLLTFETLLGSTQQSPNA